MANRPRTREHFPRMKERGGRRRNGERQPHDPLAAFIAFAESLGIALEAWQQVWLEVSGFFPEKALVLTSGERYKVAAASRRGGRGLSGDLVLLDELREGGEYDGPGWEQAGPTPGGIPGLTDDEADAFMDFILRED